ncbi:hypothetical protein ACFSSA_06475 [Luteolibacter algae]|uniref:Uncharacterized protein n=1 Tax=Luteolibacter algae TaxID=454151 RepID=A0ABW5D5I8_9BACT
MKSHSYSWIWIALVCCLLHPVHLSHGQGEENPYRNWPEQWVLAYKRLDTFIKAKDLYWPTSDLTISEDGEIHHSLSINTTSSEHLTLCLFEYGSGSSEWAISTSTNSSEHGNRYLPKLNPGTYVALIRSFGTLGYQYHFPIVYLEVNHGDASAQKQSTSGLVVRTIRPGGAGLPDWPDRRVCVFSDFHVARDHRNPNDLKHRNELVDPSVVLALHNDGVIRRELLPEPELEKQLYWRIYKYNKLVATRPAAGQSSIAVADGIGSYRVFLCVNGPTGFMPVSNMISFPLFPSSDGGVECVPADKNRDNIPDAIAQIIDHGDGNPSRDPDRDEMMIRLWSDWKWTLTAGLQKPIGLIVDMEKRGLDE